MACDGKPTRGRLDTEPLVSVCIAVFNCEEFIGETIRSILAQTFADFEILVVDNASSDGTAKVVRTFQDPRVRLLTNPTNIGPCLNWNRSIEESCGRYVKLIGADDVLYPRCLEEQLGAFEGPDGASIALACFPRDIIDATGRVILRSHGWRTVAAGSRLPGRTAIKMMARRGRNLIGEPVSAFFRRSDAIELGCFSQAIETRFPFCLDWDLWCRLLQRGDLHVAGSPLGAFRVNSGSNSLNLVRQFADNDRGYIRYLRENGLADITAEDYWIGGLRAFRDAWLRRAFYLYLRSAKTLRRSPAASA